jgi:hypothetical protein
VLALILSDVVGNNLAAIASGPTVLDAAHPAAALAVVDQYDLRGQLPAAVMQRLTHGTGPIGEPPAKVENRLVETSSESLTDYLCIYKTYLLDKSSQQFYYERSGRYTRTFSSKLVDIKTAFFSGPCIWTYLEYSTTVNDSTSQNIIIDEYYAKEIGLVKIQHQVQSIVNGAIKSDSIVRKYRVF